MLLPTLFAVAPPLLCFFPFIFRCKSPTSGKKGMQSSGPRSFLHLFLDKAASGNPSRPCLRPHLAPLRLFALLSVYFACRFNESLAKSLVVRHPLLGGALDFRQPLFPVFRRRDDTPCKANIELGVHTASQRAVEWD